MLVVAKVLGFRGVLIVELSVDIANGSTPVEVTSWQFINCPFHVVCPDNVYIVGHFISLLNVLILEMNKLINNMQTSKSA